MTLSHKTMLDCFTFPMDPSCGFSTISQNFLLSHPVREFFRVNILVILEIPRGKNSLGRVNFEWSTIGMHLLREEFQLNILQMLAIHPKCSPNAIHHTDLNRNKSRLILLLRNKGISTPFLTSPKKH